MLRHAIILLILTTAFTTACKSTPPDSAKETLSAPTVDAEDSQKLDPAQALAQKIYIAHGGPAFSNIKRIQFSFDVQSESKSIFKAQHDWNLTDKTDLIQWTTPDSTQLDLLLNLESNTVSGTANDTPITETQATALAADAQTRWINDTYWLLMPLKLRDPGVNLTLESPRTIDDVTYEVLHMTFENVGLTPGDQYWVYVDPTTHHIARWDMLLQGQTTEPSTVLWENYQKIGPLTLPTTRSWPDSPKQIIFENTRIENTNGAPPNSLIGTEIRSAHYIKTTQVRAAPRPRSSAG